MAWNQEQIDAVAVGSATVDYSAFEAIGLDELEEARILDIGCFDGFNTVLKFAPYANAVDIVGLDPYEPALEQARNRTTDPRFKWVLGDLDDLEDQDGSFDLVYLSHTFQHLPNKEAALERIWQLLKPGGFVVIKTVDDSCKVSHPDPEHLMRQIHEVYERSIRPNVWWTANTDRNNGSKCFALLTQAGFSDVRVKLFHTNTTGMNRAQREKFFNRMVYFRRKVPDCAGVEEQELMADLLDRWHDLFLQPDYFFDSPTFLALARKPLSAADAQPGDRELEQDSKGFTYAGPAFNEGCRTDVQEQRYSADSAGHSGSKVPPSRYSADSAEGSDTNQLLGMRCSADSAEGSDTNQLLDMRCSADSAGQEIRGIKPPRISQPEAKADSACQAAPNAQPEAKAESETAALPETLQPEAKADSVCQAASNAQPEAKADSAYKAALEWTIQPMEEDDLGGVMAIEVRSFPSPWSPLAYAMELRYNNAAHYVVARNAEGQIGGFVGWWYNDDIATIAHIAVNPDIKRQGLGTRLLEHACKAARDVGKVIMQLQVRKANETARAFYQALGFGEVGVTQNYYTNPDDDGIIMLKPLR